MGRTALHCAAMRNLPEVVKMLLTSEKFTDVNACDRRGCTALHVAASKGHNEVVEALVSNYLTSGKLGPTAYVDFELKDANGNTAQEVAKHRRHEGVVAIFDQLELFLFWKFFLLRSSGQQ